MRAKFKVDVVKQYNNGVDWQEVELSAVYSGENNSEDNQFSNATPNGKLTMTITNPKAIDYLKPGKSYYLDFIEADIK